MADTHHQSSYDASPSIVRIPDREIRELWVLHQKLVWCPPEGHRTLAALTLAVGLACLLVMEILQFLVQRTLAVSAVSLVFDYRPRSTPSISAVINFFDSYAGFLGGMAIARLILSIVSMLAVICRHRIAAVLFSSGLVLGFFVVLLGNLVFFMRGMDIWRTHSRLADDHPSLHIALCFYVACSLFFFCFSFSRLTLKGSRTAPEEYENDALESNK